MMWISEFAYQIVTFSNHPGLTVRAARRPMRTFCVSLIAAALVLGPAPATAQGREQVRVVFEYAHSNVEGK